MVSWGYRHTSPAAFVAAWRHVVNVFRAQGAYNVTWLWTINIIDNRAAAFRTAALVAGQLICDLGGDRRLLPQAHGSSFPCSARPSKPSVR